MHNKSLIHDTKGTLFFIYTLYLIQMFFNKIQLLNIKIFLEYFNSLRYFFNFPSRYYCTIDYLFIPLQFEGSISSNVNLQPYILKRFTKLVINNINSTYWKSTFNQPSMFFCAQYYLIFFAHHY